ncbi:MAG: class I SAM-dependent methyltransferase [Cypionkella sp.]
MNADAPFQTDAAKDLTRQNWDNAAAGWDKHAASIRKWLRRPTDAMLKMAGVAPGHTVLDLAAGAGDQTLDLAARVGPEGKVVASDISAQILALALQNASKAGHRNVETHVADAEHLDLAENSFDAAVCRLGLMFLPDPLAGLGQVRHSLIAGGRFCSMVFAGPEQNPCLRILMTTALRHAGLPPRDPYLPGGLVSLGRAGAIDALFRKAGFSAVATTRMEAPFRMATTGHYLDFIRDAAGPILQILALLSDAAKAEAWADMAEQLSTFQTPEAWIGPNTLLLTVGQK